MRPLRPALLVVVVALACIGAPLQAQSRSRAADSAQVVAVVERLRDAMARGDSAAVLALLAPDLVVLESGDVERRAEYRRHHLPADIEFARAVRGVHTPVSVVVQGDVAWASATSVSTGTFRTRAVDSAGAELIVLSRAKPRSPWRVRAIHWSSHPRKR